jgi:hypothetical protein
MQIFFVPRANPTLILLQHKVLLPEELFNDVNLFFAPRFNGAFEGKWCCIDALWQSKK